MRTASPHPKLFRVAARVDHRLRASPCDLSKLGVYTAYEISGKRFDSKTRLPRPDALSFARGLRPALPFTLRRYSFDVLGWRLDADHHFHGLLVIVYTSQAAAPP